MEGMASAKLKNDLKRRTDRDLNPKGHALFWKWQFPSILLYFLCLTEIYLANGSTATG